MTSRERILQRRATFVASAIAGVALGCSSERTPMPAPQPCLTYDCSQGANPPTRLELEPSPDSLCIGTVYELNANKVVCDRPGHVTPEWKSGDPNIATIDVVGRVRPLTPGTVTITAVYETLVTSKTFEVLPCDDAGVADAASDAPAGDATDAD